jgi:choloylglycine hydrolase
MLKIFCKAFLCLLAGMSFITTEAAACSLAVLNGNGNMIIARTMDWKTPDGDVVKNYPGIKRTAQLILLNPYEWTSKYGSISFNLIEDVPLLGATSVPGCGLNKKGLYAAELWVTGPPRVKYPLDSSKPWLTSAEVVQMLLDNCANVEEAIAQFNKVSLEGFTLFHSLDMSLDLHYFVTDSSGKTAILEYPNGHMNVKVSPSHNVMTNNFLNASNAALIKLKGFGGTQDIPKVISFAKKTSLMRYVLTCDSLVRLQDSGQVTIDSGFTLLDRISTLNSPVTAGGKHRITTQWSIVYDMTNKIITYTSSQNSNKRIINMSNLTFPMRIPTEKRISVQSSDVGNITNIFSD